MAEERPNIEVGNATVSLALRDATGFEVVTRCALTQAHQFEAIGVGSPSRVAAKEIVKVIPREHREASEVRSCDRLERTVN
ncbi:hypothetical protein [Bradyrhizobium sp. NBAIM02]|uniref:hypothetical protein n=1 Tax=Bradyrhizobium sp. NBAIM02 TaxID=2793817 RepID=UPI001CD70848|nr:hypothetical protein [Bradyrhizobium sp. NBAIM02]MCA1503804.1 hypothetical protein [Bradyrhizobium sp. NBAIM02]